MQNLPHHYTVTAAAHPADNVALTSPGLPVMASAPPAEFGGPGDHWSPETLLVAAVADCFILTFKAIARASKMDWVNLNCDVAGTLDRVDKVSRFTEFKLHAVLDVPDGTDRDKAMRLLEKSEQVCLITNSLNASMHLEAEVRINSV